MTKLIANAVFKLITVIIFEYLSPTWSNDVDVIQHPGHLQKFGYSGPFKNVKEVSSFLPVDVFHRDYVNRSLPLKFTRVVKQTKPCVEWSDEYFLSLEVPTGSTVEVENKKKEDRKAGTNNIHFHEFVNTYNYSDIYMVQDVPEYLAKDVTLPDVLQCPEIYNNVIDAFVFWFSSGGTKSVVHTDSYENIICVYHGVKEMVLVDPNKFKDDVHIDHPESAYSGMDVDKVDYTKYPGLVNVEYYRVNLTAGDCMYIPYKWIHQVRSYYRNIAVNIWWNHDKWNDLDFTKRICDVDTNLTLDKVQLPEADGELTKDGLIAFLQKLTYIRAATLDHFQHHLMGLLNFDNAAYMAFRDDVNDLLDEMIDILDKDTNNMITSQEANSLTDSEQDELISIFMEISFIMLEAEEEIDKESQHDEL